MKKEISTPYVVTHQKRDIDTKKADHYANIRCVLLCPADRLC